MAESEFDPYSRTCPSRRLLDEIGGLWTVLVVGALADGPLRFGQIAERVDGLSQKMLTQTLRALERDGLVTRTVYPEVPVRVEYALTDAGRSLLAPLRALQEWSIEHLSDVSTSQQEFDRRD